MLHRATALLWLAALAPLPAQASQHIRIDQFGYRPLATKVAVLREPIQGYDAPATYVPGIALEVRRTSDGSTAWSGAPSAWNGGALHAQSGDNAWWLDFTALQEEGEFVIYDPSNGEQSEPFRIAPDVYLEPLKQAVRMYYYQRCGTAKAVPFTDAAWADTPCHVGTEQDTDCRYVHNTSPSSSLDLSGGWHDAGDYNKYVNYADGALHDLLAAYEAQPNLWSDDYNIPESGNGVPDLLDEIAWELDWLLKMQEPDGSVHHKMGATNWSSGSPVSADSEARRYAEITASATISACGAFAHAASVFGTLPSMAAYASQLEAAALAAWDWLEQNPSSIPSFYGNSGFVTTACEDSSDWQSANRTAAACRLFVLTGDPAFRVYVDANYTQVHLLQWRWASPWETELNDALLAYCQAPGATLSVVTHIESTFADSVTGWDWLIQAQSDTDAYRAYLKDADWTWGSNRTKAQVGIMMLLVNRLGLATAQTADLLEASEDFLHYLHGVNPVGFAFLTNMGNYGADGSLDQMYHQWFGDGTPWDSVANSLYGPPPGYVTGGPNPQFRPDSSYQGPPLEPPMNQPVQKSYRDWNAGWPENSWEVTESHIPYQASYVRLLAEYAATTPTVLSLNPGDLLSGAANGLTVGGADSGSLVGIAWATRAGYFATTAGGWCVELGLALPANPMGQVAGYAIADASGNATIAVTVPSQAAGMTVLMQAAQQGTSPYPVQSAVVATTIL